MIPHSFPTQVSSNTGRPEMIVYYLGSVVGLTRWVDYIPVRTVQIASEIPTENTTASAGFEAVSPLSSISGLTSWRDYVPVYEDGAATVPFVTDTNGYIPVGLSGAGGASLVLNFAYRKALDSRITFTRASSATYFDANGVLQSATTNTARFDHDPVTGICKGLLIEGARTNLVLNSLLNGTNLNTQSVTVTAVAHTLSFYGTGTVTLSGASTAGPLVGTGDTTRVSLTFTPTAGSLTLTVSGTVKWCNLEIGAFATSFIPTAGTALTRSADVCSMTGTNFSDWFNASEGTFVCDFDSVVTGSTATRVFQLNTSGSESAYFRLEGTSSGYNFNSSTANWTLSATVTRNSSHKSACAFKANDCALVFNGSAASNDTTTTIPTVAELNIGRSPTVANRELNGHISRLAFYPKRLSNTILQGLTT